MLFRSVTKMLFRSRTNRLRDLISFEKSGQAHIFMLNDLEFAYAPVRDRVRDLREYL